MKKKISIVKTMYKVVWVAGIFGSLQGMEDAKVALDYKDAKYIPHDYNLIARDKIHDIIVAGLCRKNSHRLMNKAKYQLPGSQCVWLTKVTLPSGRRELLAHMRWRNQFGSVGIDFYHYEIITSRQFLGSVNKI